MLGQRWVNVRPATLAQHLPNAGPTLTQHWANASCLLGYTLNGAHTRHWPIGGSMLGKRLRRWPNIDATFCFSAYPSKHDVGPTLNHQWVNVSCLLWCTRPPQINCCGPPLSSPALFDPWDRRKTYLQENDRPDHSVQSFDARLGLSCCWLTGNWEWGGLSCYNVSETVCMWILIAKCRES